MLSLRRGALKRRRSSMLDAMKRTVYDPVVPTHARRRSNRKQTQVCHGRAKDENTQTYPTRLLRNRIR